MTTMKVPFLDLVAQYNAIRPEIDSAISEVIMSASFVGGAKLKEFEQAFADFQGAEFCVGVGNGTDALEIAIEALRLPAGEIIVPANTFIASGEAVTRTGHRVVFCDVDPKYYTLSPESASLMVSENTVAIMPVHLYGQPCDMEGVLRLAKQAKLAVIEDCAQAHGAEWHGRRVGTIGDIGTFSFYPGKNLGAYGDGGAVTTNSEELAERCRMIANHGRLEKYDHEFEGRNSRLDTLQAAILRVKLEHLDDWIEHRRQVAQWYREGLEHAPALVLPEERDGARHVYHLYVIQTEYRDELRRWLQDRNIVCGVHYPKALPELTAYSYLDAGIQDEKTARLGLKCLSLPMGEHLSRDQVQTVISTILEFLNTTAP